MGALPRPDIPPGARRDLIDALHDLHHRAGWPSLRRLARQAGCSHTTVSAVFSTARLPSWGVLELLVEAMGGDTAEFHRLWLAAGRPVGSESTTRPRIAGRRTELATVRQHLQTGTGLLLVTGEAGIGKTTLINAVAGAGDTFVATGHCLPLSSQVPLMPIIDALTAIYDVDEGLWFKEALVDLPPYVRHSLVRLLPQLGGHTAVADADEFARQQLFSSVEGVLRRLAAIRSLALVVEDLHWADPTTLDLVEHLLARSVPVPVVGSWRTEDPNTPQASSDWFARVQRFSDVRALRLGPLTRDETAEQLALLGTRLPERLDSIHSRTLGQPLFTEQLAAHLDADHGLPEQLAELLDRRLDGLSDSGWAVLRTLGVAERPLLPAQLAAASKIRPDQLTTELHALQTRRLVRSSTDERVQLHHPLLAEATQRRLVPGEGAGVHRSLAEVLGAGPEASAAEVANHWRSAGNRERELEWRVSAARSSAAAFEWAQEAEHWLRTLDLWPPAVHSVGDPPVSRPMAYVAAIDSLRESLQWDRAAAMSDAADEELGAVDDATSAELLLRAADYRGDREGVAIGLRLVDQALEVFARLPASAGHLRALNHKRWYLAAIGDYDEALAVARAAVEVAEAVGDRRLHRNQLISLAWHEGIEGALTTMFDLLTQGRALLPDGADPLGDIRSSMNAAHVLLICGASLECVEDAARPGLEVARARAIDNESAIALTAHVATARLRAGLVARAEAGIGAAEGQRLDLSRWPVELLRTAVDARKGHVSSAADRVQRLLPEVLVHDEADLEVLCVAADIDFWRGTVHATLPRLLRDLENTVDSSPVRISLPALVTATRGVAEEARLRRPASSAAVSSVRDMVSRSCLHLRPTDGDDPHLRAHIATAQAELARAVRADHVAVWAGAARLWDGLGRPHDAAYCRWRGAQVALRDRQGTVAARLLKRAATDAREHVPLSAAVAAATLTTS